MQVAIDRGAAWARALEKVCIVIKVYKSPPPGASVQCHQGPTELLLNYFNDPALVLVLILLASPERYTNLSPENSKSQMVIPWTLPFATLLTDSSRTAAHLSATLSNVVFHSR